MKSSHLAANAASISSAGENSIVIVGGANQAAWELSASFTEVCVGYAILV